MTYSFLLYRYWWNTRIFPWSSTRKWSGWICCQDGQEHPQEGNEKQKWPLPRNTCSTKHPYRIYGFESSTKTAGKTHQKPTAHNSWTSSNHSMSTQRTSTSESKRVNKNKRTTTTVKQETYPRYNKEMLYTWDHSHWMGRHGARQRWQKDWMSDHTATEDASYRWNRVDLWKTQERSQPDTSSIKRREVDSGNGCQKPQPLCQPASLSPSNNQKSCSTQVTTAPPRSEKPELGRPNKPVSSTSVSVPTETRPNGAVREPAYLKDYIRNWTVNSRFTNIESKRQIPRIRTRLGTISIIYIFIFFICFLFS